MKSRSALPHGAVLSQHFAIMPLYYDASHHALAGMVHSAPGGRSMISDDCRPWEYFPDFFALVQVRERAEASADVARLTEIATWARNLPRPTQRNEPPTPAVYEDIARDGEWFRAARLCLTQVPLLHELTVLILRARVQGLIDQEVAVAAQRTIAQQLQAANETKLLYERVWERMLASLKAMDAALANGDEGPPLTYIGEWDEAQ
jgi:hypothetical protein